MKKSLYVILSILLAQALIIGCGQKENTANLNPPTNFNAQKMDADKFVQKVDTFVVILDASDSMEKIYLKTKKERKIDTAVNALISLFATLPDDEFTAGLRVFGAPQKAHLDDTPILYWLTDTNRSALVEALKQVEPGRNYASSLALALNRTADTLLTVDSRPEPGGKTLDHVGVDATDTAFKANRGKIAVIVVSDGLDKPLDSIVAGRHLKARYGDRLNLYTIIVGYDETGIQAMNELATAGGGFAVRATDLTSAGEMQAYAEKVLVSRDGDGDHVADTIDNCPDTPMGAMADVYGCTPDMDKDGVYDYLDRCPRTPEGLAVNAAGCPADTDADGKYDDYDQSPTAPEWINDLKWGSISPEIRYLWFDVNAHALRPWMFSILDEYAAFLKIHRDVTLDVRGYASSPGTRSQNNTLSKKRASAAKAYLVNAGVDPDRINMSFYGKDNPLADSKTDLGRNLNRRVELQLAR